MKSVDRIRNAILKNDMCIWAFILVVIILSRILLYIAFWRYNPSASFSDFLNITNNFDAKWYRKIALDGYNIIPRDSSGYIELPFFPLYPRIVGIIYLVFNKAVDVYMIAFVLSNLFLAGSLFYALKYIEIKGMDTWIWFIYVFLMTFGLMSFYFMLFFTEAPYLFFLTACFYYLEKKEYLKMGLFGALLSATRNLGVFFCFAVAAKCAVDYIGSHKGEKRGSITDFVKTYIFDAGLVFGVSMIPLGLFAHMLYLYLKIGDGLAFVHAQYAWGRINTGVLRQVQSSLFEGDILGYWAVGGILLICIIVFERKRYTEGIFAAISLCIPLLSSTMSVGRFLAGGFVFKLALSEQLKDAGKTVRIFALVFSFFYELILFYALLNEDFTIA